MKRIIALTVVLITALVVSHAQQTVVNGQKAVYNSRTGKWAYTNAVTADTNWTAYISGKLGKEDSLIYVTHWYLDSVVNNIVAGGGGITQQQLNDSASALRAAIGTTGSLTINGTGISGSSEGDMLFTHNSKVYSSPSVNYSTESNKLQLSLTTIAGVAAPTMADDAATKAYVDAAIPASLPPSGSAGGNLAGSYPNPSIASNSITSAQIANGTIALADLSATGTASAATYLRGDNTWAVPSAATSLTTTDVKTNNYSANANEFVPCAATSASISIILPSAPADKTLMGVKLVALSGSNTVSVLCAGGDVFNITGGSTTITLSLLNQSINLQYSASSGVWYITSTDLPLSGSDARYAPYALNVSGANLTNLNASSISSGTVPATRLGSGTPSATTFLRGDGLWSTAVAHGFIGIQVFSVAGTYTYTPTPGCTRIVVEIAGGGGGSGGADGRSSAIGISGGGGGGGYTLATIASFTWTSTVLTVGAGGSAGSVTGSCSVTPCSGGDGGTSSFVNGTTTITATGGGGSTRVTSTSNTKQAAGGTGGTTTDGDFLGQGQAGQDAIGVSATCVVCGNGGTAGPFGGGGIGSIAAAQSGSPGTGYGAGGGGSASGASSLSFFAGAAGMSGIVIIYEYN